MKAVIAIGANLGSPQENIDLAVALLREATDIQAVSSMYTTKPVGGPAQPDYINAVAIAESDLPNAAAIPPCAHLVEPSSTFAFVTSRTESPKVRT